MSEKSIQKPTNLLDRLVEELLRGVSLIDGLTDEIYSQANNGVGSIGAHIRHNLDFAGSFLLGLQDGEINYNNRERDIKIERDRQYAKERFLFLIQRLKSVTDNILEKDVYVCSEVDESNWCKSTGSRELEFVHSHTVHHYALISEKLKSFGIEVSSDFGVAPSTLKFWAERDEETKVA